MRYRSSSESVEVVILEELFCCLYKVKGEVELEAEAAKVSSEACQMNLEAFGRHEILSFPPLSACM